MQLWINKPSENVKDLVSQRSKLFVSTWKVYIYFFLRQESFNHLGVFLLWWFSCILCSGQAHILLNINHVSHNWHFCLARFSAPSCRFTMWLLASGVASPAYHPWHDLAHAVESWADDCFVTIAFKYFCSSSSHHFVHTVLLVGASPLSHLGFVAFI